MERRSDSSSNEISLILFESFSKTRLEIEVISLGIQMFPVALFDEINLLPSKTKILSLINLSEIYLETFILMIFTHNNNNEFKQRSI